jgi:hypothetical protein
MVLAGVFYLNTKSFSDCGEAIPSTRWRQSPGLTSSKAFDWAHSSVPDSVPKREEQNKARFPQEYPQDEALVLGACVPKMLSCF